VKRSHLVATVVAVHTIALLALVPAARALPVTPAPAARTSTHVARAHPATHHHARHRPPDRAQFTRAGSASDAPAPHAPARHRAERRAALPTATRGHRHAPTSRGGQAALAPDRIEAVAITARRLDETWSGSATGRLGRVTSGRGPPPAHPLASFAPASAPGSGTDRRSSLPPLHRFAARGPITCVAGARSHPSGVFASPFLQQPEPASGRSRVGRPEGTTTRSHPPSHGVSL